MVWTDDICKLLIWMRSQKMAYSFCAEVISREVKAKVTKNACVGKHRTLMEKK